MLVPFSFTHSLFGVEQLKGRTFSFGRALRSLRRGLLLCTTHRESKCVCVCERERETERERKGFLFRAHREGFLKEK